MAAKKKKNVLDQSDWMELQSSLAHLQVAQRAAWEGKPEYVEEPKGDFHYSEEYQELFNYAYDEVETILVEAFGKQSWMR